MLKWARENNCPWNELACSNAVLHGHLEVLKWVRKNGCRRRRQRLRRCPRDENTCAGAAKGGHLEILKHYAHNGPEGMIALGINIYVLMQLVMGT
jgi:hypothetical protein